MKTNKNKKAFTLIEMVITLSVVAVVIAMTTSVVLVVSKVANVQSYNQNCQHEYQSASKIIKKFISTYETYEYTISVQETETQSKIVCSDGLEHYNLVYDKQTNKIVADMFNYLANQTQQIQIDFKCLKNIKINKQQNIIKCEYIFDSYPTYTDLVVFGVD